MKQSITTHTNVQANKGISSLVSLFLCTVLLLALVSSCGNDSNPTQESTNPTEGLKKIQDFVIGDYTLSLYNENGELRLGYTKVYFAVKDKNGNYVSDAQLTAFPRMDMGTMTHSTPRSEITKVPGKALYEAYYSFLMYSGQGDGTWYYDLKYKIANDSDSITHQVIQVKNAFRSDGATSRRVIQSLLALDESGTYVISLVEPISPKVGLNDITAYIHKRVNANTYVPVKNLTLKLDPRMPSMENHSSPNNVDLTWDEASSIYKGKVNFSMTGYWTLNLILQNEAGDTLYGNPITTDKTYSSLFFEVEF